MNLVKKRAEFDVNKAIAGSHELYWFAEQVYGEVDYS